ncbi:hypothetical protein [Amycolatopsis sp. NPDC004169]
MTVRWVERARAGGTPHERARPEQDARVATSAGREAAGAARRAEEERGRR